MEEMAKQPQSEIISQQQQQFIARNPYVSSSSYPTPFVRTRTRKQRGIFTTTTQSTKQTLNGRINHPNTPWPVEHSHLPGLESGDHVQVQAAHSQYLQSTVEEEDRIRIASSEQQSPINYSQQNNVEQSNERNNVNDNNSDEPTLIDDVESLIGNYQVNPMDGSLVKILSIPPIDGPAPMDETVQIVSRQEPHSTFNETPQPEQTQRRKYRKRKFRETYDDDDYLPNNVKPASGIPKPAGNKAEEVLKAAKSLFSKRTRTLYHWLYPSTSKLELKNIVVSAWDTLQESEKHFYISQVLGRFGFPASNLMVNPQIGGLQGMPTDHLRNTVTSMALAAAAANPNTIPSALNGQGNVAVGVGSNELYSHSTNSDSNDATTKRVVEELLASNSENNTDWDQKFMVNRNERRGKRRKYTHHSKSSPGSDTSHEMSTVSSNGFTNTNDDEFMAPPHLEDEDFQNDPELSKEIAAFKMNTNEELRHEQLV